MSSVQYPVSGVQKQSFFLKGLGHIGIALFLVYPNNSLAVKQTDSNNGWRAQTSFFERRAEGWHWYNDPPREEKVERNHKLSIRVENCPPNRVEKLPPPLRDALV